MSNFKILDMVLFKIIDIFSRILLSLRITIYYSFITPSLRIEEYSGKYY